MQPWQVDLDLLKGLACKLGVQHWHTALVSSLGGQLWLTADLVCTSKGAVEATKISPFTENTQSTSTISLGNSNRITESSLDLLNA